MSKFLDKLSLVLKAGNGATGCSSFRREKFVPLGGPDGGDGGNGGSIFFSTSKEINSFSNLRNRKKVYKAENGNTGMTKKKQGAAGKDLYIEVPVGTLIYDERGNLIIDLNKLDMNFELVKGGKGGLGNYNFATSSNRAPTYFQQGLPGKGKKVFLELRLIAEVGLIGLPNAGKSSLLKALTLSNVEINSYPFTTITPNLGTLKTYSKEIILADIPGLIEGASKGKGLGHDFLRHIDRTHTLLHLVSADSENCFNDYETIIKELKNSTYDLSEKKCIVLLSKSDLLEDIKIQEFITYFKNKKIDIIPISSFTKLGLSYLIEVLSNLDDEK
jgi:GTPase